MFKLQKFVEEDKSLYLSTQKEAFEKYIVEFFGKFDVNVMIGHLQKLKSDLYKIVVDNNIAGFVYFKEESDKIVVDVFCVFKEYRNCGLGSKVMASFIEIANSVNKPIVLDTFKTNPAKKFYERHGFKVVDENFSHYILKYEN